jgi:endonuclease/exonuclease/phosphatase family metal-dependent hydrolase
MSTTDKVKKRPRNYNTEVERADDNTFHTVTAYIMPKAGEFLVSFPKNNIPPARQKELEDSDESKVVISNNDLMKIFGMVRKGPAETSPYILFSFSYIHTDVISDTITTFKIDYRLLMYLINFFHIRFPNDRVVKIRKESLIKIFDLLNLPINDRIALMRFFLVEENTVYIDTKLGDYENFGNFSNELLNFEIPQKPRRVKNRKVRLIGGKHNTCNKLPQTNFDDLNTFMNRIPDILKLNKKAKIEPKPIRVEGTLRHSRQKSVEPMTRRSDITAFPENANNYPINLRIKNIKRTELGKKTVQNERKKEVSEKRKVTLRVKSRSVKVDRQIYYPFILRKLPEYGDSPIYLCGSLPQLAEWDTSKAPQMDEEIRNGELFYTKYVPVKRNQFPFEYKYFYIKDGEINWVGLPYDNFMTHPQYYKLVHTLKKASISVLDLNIRYLNEVDGLNIWDNRKKHLIDVLLNSYCDVFFFQEITKTQFMYIDKYLNSAYEFVGVYRDSTDASEKCSISYNIFKYTLTDWGQFWLSSTPYEPGSNDFKNFFPRICTWAALKQINGINILFFNIHLDHVNFEAHFPCIKVALEESEKIINRFNDCQFIVLGGCFYCEGDDPVIEMVRDYGYTEVQHENTFHDFTGEVDRHWDYIFYKEKEMGTFELVSAKVLKEEGTIDAHRQMFVSDHFPTVVQFKQLNPYQNSD